MFIFSLYPKLAVADNPSATSEINCLAKAIYFEARGGSEKDMKDVGHVVLNRTNNPKFPSNVCNVVYQKYKGTCQFSWACKSYTVKDRNEFDKSKEYAKTLLDAESKGGRLDPTKRALFFHNTRVSPNWNKSVCHINKQHIFYK